MMRDADRIAPFCNALASLWREYFPDLRFCQMLYVIMDEMPNEYFKKDPFYAEEKDWLSAIQKVKEKVERGG